MNTTTLTTPNGQSYPIVTGSGLLSQLGAMLRELTSPCRVMIVTDNNVAPLYLPQTVKSLESAGFSVHTLTVPAGEESKSLPTLGKVLDAFCEAKMTRTDLALALGGGVVGDLTGFAAGCYLRGIRFVQVPTTLLAAVDASVGGKTAVNLPHGKNLAGLFHQPIGVYCDIDALGTLPAHEISDGAAEAIKHGILDDPQLFSIYETGNSAESYEEIIVRSVQFKSKIVMQDPNEKGLRKLLNFGHTPAHSIERLSNFEISHGHAVGIGMAIMSRAACKRGLIEKDVCTRILNTIVRSELPVICPYSAHELAEIAALDKKAAGDEITVILPQKIGQCSMQKIKLSSLESLFADGLEGQE